MLYTINQLQNPMRERKGSKVKREKRVSVPVPLLVAISVVLGLVLSYICRDAKVGKHR